MKRIAPLLLLPLLLAACGQPSTPSAASSSSALPSSVMTGTASAADIARFETGVERDLAALGLSGQLTAQAAAPKSYLNVLKVNDSSARAYLKTTFPTATGCTLDWGDSSTQSINTPSTVATDQQNHTYAQSGTYTIKLTCGTDVKISSFHATVVSSGLFDSYVGEFYFNRGGEESGAAGSYYDGQGFNYNEQGFKFTGDSHLYMVRNGWGLPQGHTGISIPCANEGGSFKTINGDLFNIISISAGSIYGANIQITGYDSAGRIIAATSFTNNSSAGQPIETRTLGWNNVGKVVCNGNGYLHLDDMAATINTPL